MLYTALLLLFVGNQPVGAYQLRCSTVLHHVTMHHRHGPSTAALTDLLTDFPTANVKREDVDWVMQVRAEKARCKELGIPYKPIPKPSERRALEKKQADNAALLAVTAVGLGVVSGGGYLLLGSEIDLTFIENFNDIQFPALPF